jgi:CYTH domain-containing protein
LREFAPPSLEIERKYLLSALPRRRKDRTVRRIDQGWLPGDKVLERVRRIREGDTTRWLRTVKLGHGLVRTEIEEPIDETLFRALWRLTRGRRVSKWRYVFRDGDRVWEIDRFIGRDLVLAEVELASTDASVEPPEWLARYIVREVTGEPRYENVNLAREDGA